MQRFITKSGKWVVAAALIGGPIGITIACAVVVLVCSVFAAADFRNIFAKK